MENKPNSVISFILGMVVARYGIPAFMHCAYVATIIYLVVKIKLVGISLP